MAPARSKKGKYSTSSNVAKPGNGVDMPSGLAEINKLEPQDNDKTKMQEQWFEDKLPGNGQPENTFTNLYTSNSSWEDELDSSKNKSWFELVEDDESEDIQPSKPTTTNDKSQTLQLDSKDPLLNIDIKKEVVDDCEDESSCQGDIIYQKEQKHDQNCEEHTSDQEVLYLTNNCPTVKKMKTQDICKNQSRTRNSIDKGNILPETIVIKQEKIDDTLQWLEKSGKVEQIIDQQNLDGISIKQERGAEKIPIKCERVAGSLEDSGKRIKCEPHTDITQEKNVNKDKHEKVTEKCSTEEDGVETAEKRKRVSTSSSGSLPVKRERNASSSSSSNSSVSKKKREYERDPLILSRRQKQIDYGKNTVGYDRYRHQIPKEMRTSRHPRTPPKHLKYSRRGWDGTVKIWRQQLHVWDPEEERNRFQDSLLDTSGSITSEDTQSDQHTSEQSRFSTPSPAGYVIDDSYLEINVGDELNFGT